MKSILPVLIRKEMIQFRRNAFLPRLIVMMPLMVMLVMPWVTSMDVRNIGIAVIDHDRSSLSQRYISHVSASDYFHYYGGVPDYQTALEMLDGGKIDVIVTLPEHWERDLQRGTAGQVSVVANGVNANKGAQGMQYAVQIAGQTLREMQEEKGAVQTDGNIVVENRYNPTGNYRHFMIPALMITIMLLLCCFLPALNIVSEKETGTIEQINVTPVGKLEFTLAKLIPYWIMGLLVLSVAMLIAWWVYGLVPQGSVGVIYLGAALFAITMSGFAVAIANISSNMQQTIFVMFFFVMLFMLMSGLFTPVSSMPQWAQTVAYAFPPRYFIDLMRSVYLKGTILSELRLDIYALCILAVMMNILATVTFRKQN